eukprot:gene8190-1451_t
MVVFMSMATGVAIAAIERAKAMVAAEERKAALRSKVKVTLKNAKIALGESWKLLGPYACPELGRFPPNCPKHENR